MDDYKQSEREFYRAPANLEVRFGPDTPEGRQAMAMHQELWGVQSKLEAEARQALEDSTGQDYAPLVAMLRWLDFKVDLILHHLRQSDSSRHFPHSLHTTDISGSGFGVEGDNGLATGQSLIISLTLPDQPSRPVYAVGQVVRAEAAPSEGNRFGVRFVEIAEAERERIVRYTFRRQRQELSQRMRDEDA